MEKQVLVNESSLVNIANALRGKLGDVHIEYKTQTGHPPLTKISKTSNANSHTERDGGYGDNKSLYDEVTIPGASSINITLSYQTESANYDYVQVCQGSKSQFNSSVTKYGGSTLTKKTLTFSGDTVTFYFKSDGSGSNFLGYYAEITGVDENNEVILDMEKEEEISVPFEVRNTYKPNEMATAISDIGGELTWAAITGTKVTDYTQTYDLSPYVKDILAPTWVLFLLGTYESSSSSSLNSENTYTISPLIYKSGSAHNYIATNNKQRVLDIDTGFKNLFGYSNDSVFGSEVDHPTVTLNETDKTVTTVGDSAHLLSLKGVLIYIGKKENK